MVSSFAEQLRERRVAAGLTQEELAHLARCGVATIAALERGRSKRPRLSTARLLADAFGLQGGERASFLSASELAAGSDGAPALAARAPVLDLEGPPLPADVNPSGRTPLVGRDADLARLHQWWQDGGRFGLLTGAAGVGKTRLAGELGAAVRASGAFVLVGRCPRDLGGPYAAVVEALRSAALALADSTLAASLGSNGDLVRLLPELAQRLPNLARPVSGDAASERYGLFAAVASLLRACGRCLLILDDVQWLDASSAELLSHLANAPELDELAVLATARPPDPGTPWARALAEFTRRRALEAISVEGLGVDAVAELVSSLLDGAHPDPAVVEAVVGATGGNPFLAEELVAHLAATGQLVLDGSNAGLRDGSLTLGVPQLVRETLRGRYAALSRPAVALLGAGSVLGREFDPLAAADIAGLDRAAAVDAAEELLASGLWAETGVGLVLFSHALVQSAVFDQLSQVRRGELHRRAAEMGERAAGGASIPAVSAVARHWREALRVQPELVDRAATWAVRAGEEALRSAAFAEAVDAFTDAVELWEAAGSVGDQLVTALLRLGDALGFVGRRTQADDAFRRALAHAETIGQVAAQARAALGIGRLYLYGDVDPVRVETIARVLDRLDDRDTVHRPALASMLLSLLEFDDRPGAEPRRAALRDIVDASVASGPVSDELAGLLAFARPQLALEEPGTLARAADAIVGRGRDAGDLMMEANGHFARAWAALGAGDRSALTAVAVSYGAVAERLRLSEEQAYVHIVRGALAQVDGRFAELDELTRETFALNEAAGNRNRFLILASQMSLAALDRGEAAALLPQLRSLAAEQPRVSSLWGSVPLCAALAGERDEAVAALDAAAAAGFDNIARDANWHVAIAALSHACALLERRAHAEDLARLLATSRAAVVRVGPILGWWGPVAHHAGALLRLAGHHEEADRQLAEAARITAGFSRGAFVSRTEIERGLLLADRGDLPAARRCLAAALVHAEGLGAAAIVREAERLQRRLDS